MFKEERSSPDGGKGLNKNLASVGVKLLLDPVETSGAQPAPRGSFCLKVRRVGPVYPHDGQCGGHGGHVSVSCAHSYLVEVATICSRGLPLSHGHLSREGSSCELHRPTLPAAWGKSLGALAGEKGLGRAPKPVLSHKTQKSFESEDWFINLNVPRDFASLYIPRYTFNWWRNQGKNQEQNSPAHPKSCSKDGVQATASLLQRSASPLEYPAVTATANPISCPTVPHTSQSSSVTNRWHQKHPHLFQLIYALRIYWLKCPFPSTQTSHVEKTLRALNPPPNLVTYSFPFAIWPLSWKVTWMLKKKKKKGW